MKFGCQRYELFFNIFSLIDEDETIDENYLEGKKLIEDLGFDSIAIIQFCCELESYFEINFSVEEVIENINEIEKIISLVERKHKEINYQLKKCC